MQSYPLIAQIEFSFDAGIKNRVHFSFKKEAKKTLPSSSARDLQCVREARSRQQYSSQDIQMG